MPPAQVIAGRSPRKPPDREPPVDSSNHSKINFIAFKYRKSYVKLDLRAARPMFSSNLLIFLQKPYDDFPQAPVI